MKAEVSSKNKNLILISGENLYTGENSFTNYFSELTSLEKDLLNLASVVYAADLAVKREEREDFIRDIKIKVEVVNFSSFNSMKSEVEKVLSILSSDNWEIEFKKISGSVEGEIEKRKKEGTVLLFSGGLDSFSAAVDLAYKKEKLSLVGHVTMNKSVKDSQDSLFNELKKFFKKDIELFQARVYGRSKKGKYEFPTDSQRENTQRTRSFLFLTLATIFARKKGNNKVVYIAENGQFAIHLPLSSARVGPFSTHTAHPRFVKSIKELLANLLDFQDLIIENPYLYYTKGEVVSILTKEFHKSLIKSVSCWKASRVSDKNHCGECIPCFARRISIECNKIKLDEYSRNLFNEDIENLSHENQGKRNLIDFVGFISKFSDTSISKDKLLMQFPELYERVLDIDKSIEMYRRFAKEANDVFQNYPEVLKIMK